MEAEIAAHIPNIDPLISKYACGYLEHVVNLPDADGNASSSLVESLTALLVSASGDFSPGNETALRTLVEKLIARVNAKNGINGATRQLATSAKRLDQSVHVGSARNMSSTLALTGGNVDLEATAGRKIESKVDKKKLEKAERKIRAKQERKVMKNVEYETSRLLNQTDEAQSYEEFYMAVNPLQLGADAASKSKDIKIDGIDITIGGLRILSDTNLTLAYGRRYGLVGQNGIGMHYSLNLHDVFTALMGVRPKQVNLRYSEHLAGERLQFQRISPFSTWNRRCVIPNSWLTVHAQLTNSPDHGR